MHQAIEVGMIPFLELERDRGVCPAGGVLPHDDEEEGKHEQGNADDTQSSASTGQGETVRIELPWVSVPVRSLLRAIPMSHHHLPCV